MGVGTSGEMERSGGREDDVGKMPGSGEGAEDSEYKETTLSDRLPVRTLQGLKGFTVTCL